MDKRSILALFLILIVIVGGTMIQARMYPPTIDTTTVVDSVARDSASSVPAAPSAIAPRSDTVPAIAPSPAATAATAASSTVARAETTTVIAEGRSLHLVSPGGVLESVTIPAYRDLDAGEGPVVMRPTAGPLLSYRIVSGADTTRLDQLTYTRSQTPNGVEFASANPAVRIRYAADSANYLTRVSIAMPAAGPGAHLLVDMASDLTSGEADEAEDIRNLAYSYRPARSDVESVLLSSLDEDDPLVRAGPLEWAAIRNKYFLLAVMASDSTRPLGGIHMRWAPPRNDRPNGVATATLPLSGGEAQFTIYTGPQSWSVLRTVGHELSNVNPYGWAWIRPAVEPFATIVMRMLLGMKALVGLSYGWVLVIFGVLIRLAMWPLQQTAMRTSIRMQAIQPELQALQKRYAGDPEAQRNAMMKLYAENGMSPLSPLMGCLPMLIPMPILMALYFVFQNTIEFRGVPFLWLPDISLKDPFYIIPFVMGVSMLAMSLIGLRAGPPNPQAKMMAYMMPVMFTVIFLNFASGLNLYYAVQNLVGLPQQWLLTRERTKAAASAAVKGPPPTKQRK